MNLHPTQQQQLHKLVTLLTYSDQGAFAVALYDRVATRHAMLQTVREQVERRIYEVTLTGSKRNPIDLIRDLQPQAGEVVCLYDIERAFPDALGYLDLQREVLADLNISLVVWVNHYEYRELATRAPNFYAFRTSTFDFTNPAEIPVTAPLFVGREPDMETLRGLLEKGGCVTLTGYGGVGKSTLALQLSRRMRSRFQETVWVNCETRPLLGDILLQVAVVLMGEGMRQVGPDEQRKRLAKALCERPCLIVLDNFESVGEDHDLLHWLKTVSAPSAVLLTSRQQVPDLDAPNYSLPELPPNEAVEMFTLRARQAGWQGEEADVVPRLCELIGNLPLAIELLAARADELPLSQLLEEVGKSLNALVSGDDPLRAERHQSIAACFRVSFDRLSDTAKDLLKRLSILPDGASEQIIADFTKIQDWQQPVEECIAHSMLEFDGKRYRFHPLIGRFVATQVDSEQQAKYHFVSFFYNFVQANDEVNNVGRMALMVAEWNNAVAAVRAAKEIGDWEAVVQMTTHFGDFVQLRGLWSELEQSAVWAVAASESAVGTSMRSSALNNLGTIYLSQGRWNEAEYCFDEDMRLCRAAGDINGLGKTLANLGVTYVHQARWQESQKALEESLLIAQHAEDIHAAGSILTSLAGVYLQRKQEKKAEQAYKDSILFLEQSRDFRSLRVTLNNFGVMLKSAKRFREADAVLKKSLEASQKFDDVMGVARCLGNLAVLREQQGDLIQALCYAREAVEAFQKTEDRLSQAQAQAHLLQLEKKAQHRKKRSN